MGNRDNILDPELYVLKAGTSVWAAKKLELGESRFKLVPHSMKTDLKIRGPLHSFDWSTASRLIADPSIPAGELVMALRGKPITFDESAKPLLYARLSLEALAVVVKNHQEFSVQDLVYAEYSIVSTGKEEWPLLVCETKQLEFNYEDDTNP